MLEYKNLVKRFGSKTVIKGLSLKIEKGQILFVLGTSGTGKSVLLKNTVGLLQPDEGEIWINGQEVSKLSEDEYFPVRQKCGMVFQQPALFDSLTIYQNVSYGLRNLTKDPEVVIQEKVKKALEMVNLKDVEQLFPSQISYGMQKRASLARTIILQPEILLFDEPTTGLDPQTTTAINELIQKLSRQLNTTSVVVSHDMGCALKIADRIVVLDQGQIIEQGTVEEIKKSKVPLVVDFLSEVMESA